MITSLQGGLFCSSFFAYLSFKDCFEKYNTFPPSGSAFKSQNVIVLLKYLLNVSGLV